ncbi:RAN GTPase-activating protein 1 [Diplonema papillatum]|nr:RAN GTPase-activating protein 1 [Diplonema papillatum]
MGCCTSNAQTPVSNIEQIEGGCAESDFSGMRLSQAHLVSLSEQLSRDSKTGKEQGPNLQCLLLNWCSLKDMGIQALSNGLLHNSTLTVLSLAGNGLTNESASLLGRVLGQTNLRMCSLAENKIRIEGFRTLVAGACKSQTLTDLRLGGNEIEIEDEASVDEALVTLSTARVERTTPLAFLDLRNNVVSEPVLKALRRCLSGEMYQSQANFALSRPIIPEADDGGEMPTMKKSIAFDATSTATKKRVTLPDAEHDATHTLKRSTVTSNNKSQQLAGPDGGLSAANINISFAGSTADERTISSAALMIAHASENAGQE